MFRSFLLLKYNTQMKKGGATDKYLLAVNMNILKMLITFSYSLTDAVYRH
uniref:Uncharacterized protein n=1 Tax=Anguilla anguilla TaxID=7936 RepID=A0A0E9QH86_ANGAN